MIENYTRLSSRMFTATVVGKDKNGRKITEGRETYKTPSGVYEIKDWARLVEYAFRSAPIYQTQASTQTGASSHARAAAGSAGSQSLRVK